MHGIIDDLFYFMFKCSFFTVHYTIIGHLTIFHAISNYVIQLISVTKFLSFPDPVNLFIRRKVNYSQFFLRNAFFDPGSDLIMYFQLKEFENVKITDYTYPEENQ